MGQITPEDSAYVRSGNMGNEYACWWVQLDVGRAGGWYAGLTVSPTVMMIFPRTEHISRWSWRPGKHVERRFVWFMPEIGYALRDDWLDLRPSLGLVWPVATGGAWGAPVGAAPMASLDIGIRLGWLRVGGVARLAYNRQNDWVVLQDWSTPPGQPIQKRGHWLFPFELSIGVSF